MALLKRHRGFVGWMKGHKRQTSLFLCLTVGLTWVDLIVPVFGGLRKEKRKVAEHEERKGEGALGRTRSALLFFLIFFWKKHFFCLSPFLLSNCCHVFNIICNLFQTFSWDCGGHLHPIAKHKDWQRGLNSGQMTNVKKKKKKSPDTAEDKEEFLNVKTICLCEHFLRIWTPV